MAFAKSLILLLATVLLVEGRTMSKRATFDLSQFTGSTEKATAAAQKIIISGAIELVSVIDSTKTTLLGFIQSAKDIQTKIHTQAETEIDSIVKNAVAKASTQTGDQACITKIIGDITALGASTLLKVTDCLLDKVTAIEDLLAKAVSTADTALTMAPAAAIAIDDCKKGFFVTACEGLVAFKFVGQVNSVVADLTKIVATATTMYSTLTADLSTCAATRIAELTPATTKLVAGFAFCQVKAKLLG